MKRLVKGFLISLGMFSVIPVPFFDWDDDSLSLVMPCLPVVGGIIGGLWCLVAWLVLSLDISVVLQGLTIALLPILLTGMLHLDGFMDTMDALLSCRDKEERLRILKDPHMGAFGVAAFGILLLTYLCAGVAIAERGLWLPMLVFIPVLSRAIVSRLMSCNQPLSSTGYAASFARERGKLYHLVNILILTTLVVLTIAFGGTYDIAVLLVATVVAQLVWLLLKRQFGGISGDLCGCVITVTELAALLTLAVI